MAKKTIQLQQEIETEEEWDDFVKKPGLILVDVYSDWCGPCSGMLANLRKIKLEQGGDTLLLATAKNDNIHCLRRFRNKSRPTWMFISNQRVVRLVSGSNAPSLSKIILDELYKTKSAMESKIPRTGIDYDQLTEEEQAIADRLQEEQDEKDRIEREARDKAINERRELVVENLLESMNDFNFVVVWPHVKSDGLQQIMSAIKDLAVSTVGKPVNYQLTENDIYEMFYYANYKYSDAELEELCGEEITALLFSLGGAEEGELVQMFLEKLYGSGKYPPGDEDSLAVRLSKEKKLVKVHTPLEEPTPPPSATAVVTEEVEARKSTKTSVDVRKSDKLSLPKLPTLPTVATEEVQVPEDEEDVEIIHVPAVYIPENDNCKVLAMRILFPAITSKFDLPEPEPLPPHLIVAFDTTKNAEIMELVEQYPEETMFMGFFTSEIPEEAKLICKRVNQFERMAAKPPDARLVIQVNKKKSEPLLSYSSLGPVYVSPNIKEGEREAAIFFPEGYAEIPESEIESETDIEGLKSLEGSEESEFGEAGSLDLGEEELEDMGDDIDDMDLFGGMAIDMGKQSLGEAEGGGDMPPEFGGAEAGLSLKRARVPSGEPPEDEEGITDAVRAPSGEAPAKPPSVVEPPAEKPPSVGLVEPPSEKPPSVGLVEPPVETPAEPPAETPAEPPAEVPPETPAEAPAAPVVETPAEPAAEAEAPAAETPAEPTAEAPAEPPAEAPAEPPAEIPAETPAEPPAEAAAEPPADAPEEE